MRIIKFLRSPRISFLYKFKLIIIDLKRIFNHRLKGKFHLTGRDIFINWCYTFVNDHNGFLLKVNEREFLSRFNIPELEPMTIYLRKSPSSDLDVFLQIWVEKEYKAVVDYILSHSNAKNIRNILDAGANIGLTAIFLNRYFPESSIICIEPEEGNFSQLNKNIRLNKQGKIKALKAGLWKCEENLEVRSDFRDNRDWSFQVIESANREGKGLKGYSVKRLMEMNKWECIDLLKIDIEGAERFLFDNDATSSEFLPLVKFIAMEIHDEYHIREKIYHTLKKNGFDFIESGELTIGVNQLLIHKKA